MSRYDLRGDVQARLAEVCLFGVWLALCPPMGAADGVACPPSEAQARAQLGSTTLQQTFLPAGTASPEAERYRALEVCGGWNRVVRDDLGTPAAAGDPADGGRILLSMVHLSDVHILDAESPLRVEFLRHRRGLFLPDAEFQAGYRPQETLTAQVAESMMRQLNALGRGPVTQRAFHLAVVTGDSGDNHQLNELERFVHLLNGGRTITADSGSPGYVGVQDLTPSPLFCEYWHPQPTAGAECGGQLGAQCAPGCRDKWKAAGFPDIYPGLLEDAVQPFRATGLGLPWYTVYGNHDELVQGNFPIRAELSPVEALSHLAQRERKLVEVPVHGAFPKIKVDEFMAALLNPLQSSGDWKKLSELWTGPDARTVPADSGRKLWTRAEFVQMLKDNPGPHGPRGHGFADVPTDGAQLHYAFDLAPGIRGIVLDTNNPNGLSGGSLSSAQLSWLENELREVHSEYRSKRGRKVRQRKVANKLVVLFSHHNSKTLGNLLPSLDPLELRHGFGSLKKLLFRFPNVVLWLNGHTHFAKVLPHARPGSPGHGFWEVNTPSLIDFPQMARLIELRERDGVLSVFSTLVDHAAPADPSMTEDPVLRLAAISRQLAGNDPLLDMSVQIGQPGDRNTELRVLMPFDL